MEGFGQTRNHDDDRQHRMGMTPKVGSMGKPVPLYDVDIVGPARPAA